MENTATATTEEETSGAARRKAVPELTVRDRVLSALSGDQFVAAFRRRTEGSPSDPTVSRTRFGALDRLPDDPFDSTPVRTELVVYSETDVYRWVVTAGTVERTRLPRDPAALARQQ
jgi:hypothetical protein